MRNVELTAPYLHNGVLASLRDAVAFYATRDTNPERWYPRGADGSVAKFNDLPEKYHDNVNVKEVPYDRRLGQRPRLSEQRRRRAGGLSADLNRQAGRVEARVLG